MIIYRVEDCFGKGPYRGIEQRGFSRNQMEDLKEMGEYHLGSAWPAPWADNVKVGSSINPSLFIIPDDGEWPIGRDYLCGFESMEKLSNWFSSFEHVLGAAGFNVAEYEIDENTEGAVFFGDNQVVFKKSLARLDAVNDITDLLVCDICNQVWCGIHGDISSPYGVYPLRQNA